MVTISTRIKSWSYRVLVSLLIFFCSLLKRDHSKKVVFVNRSATSNVGDLKSSPSQYISLQGVKIDIMEFYKWSPIKLWKLMRSFYGSVFIVGGGGLLDRDSFELALFTLKKLKSKGKLIGWGIGHNNPSGLVSKRYQSQLKYFDLLGVRDELTKESLEKGVFWVPCASCLDTSFDQNGHHKENKAVIIEHEHIKLESQNMEGAVKIQNNLPFSKIFSWISKASFVYTNSYHAFYWSALLGKEVSVSSNSSKISQSPFMRMPERGSALLEICRNKNREFYKEVLNLIES